MPSLGEQALGTWLGLDLDSEFQTGVQLLGGHQKKTHNIWVHIGTMEQKLETTIVYRGIWVIDILFPKTRTPTCTHVGGGTLLPAFLDEVRQKRKAPAHGDWSKFPIIRGPIFGFLL